MKHLIIAISSLSLLGFASCTKVIDVNLNKSNPQYVIEGNITNSGGPQIVHITRSINYTEENKYPAVTNAIVIINDGSEKRDTLKQQVPGYYQTDRIQGIPGHTYTVRIIVDGQEFTSSSTMPQLVPIDSLSLENQSSFGKDIKVPVVTFQDPAGIRNYYNFIIYKNDVRSKMLYIDYDIVNDGERVKESLQDMDSTYNSGDKIRVEMQCISKPLYDYYFSLQQTIEQRSATPANPISNITGANVLGYFSAHTKQEHSLIVP